MTDRAFIRTRRDGRTEAVTPMYPATAGLRRLAQEHSGRTTATVELVAVEGERDVGKVLARYRNGEEVDA